MVGIVTPRILWHALQAGELPESFATRVDFGLDDPCTAPERFKAFQWAVQNGGRVFADLYDAMVDGSKLTALVNVPGNPYACEITTQWDDLEDEPRDLEPEADLPDEAG